MVGTIISRSVSTSVASLDLTTFPNADIRSRVLARSFDPSTGRVTASADQLRKVWGPFVAEAGTFEMSGTDVITMRATVAKNPAAMRDGASTVYTYRRQGDTLVLTEVRTPAGPSARPITVTLTRVE
jgi:hypothetical protein